MEVVLDVDATDDPLHGEREGRFFHGYYKNYCYLPLTRLLHKPKDPLLPRSSQEQTPRKFVIPAQAGIHFNHESLWIPACAGMTAIMQDAPPRSFPPIRAGGRLRGSGNPETRTILRHFAQHFMDKRLSVSQPAVPAARGFRVGPPDRPRLLCCSNSR